MKITVNPLSEKSIDSAIRKIEQYRRLLASKNEVLVKRLVNMGWNYAQNLAPEIAYDITAEIEGSGESTRGIIRASDEALYVEFGTGVKGYESPYPKREVMAGVTLRNPKTGFVYTDYMSGEQIFQTKDGRIGWVAPIGAGGKYVFTEGVYAKAFMYYTGKYLKEIAPKVAREVFKNG